MSLDTYGGSGLDDAYSVYNRPQDVGSGCSSDNPAHHDTLISCASPTLPSGPSSIPPVPHTPPLMTRSPRSKPSSELGLGRACNTDLSQSSSPCKNAPGGLALNKVAGVATWGGLRSDDCKDSREGQEGGEGLSPNPLGGSGSPSEGSEPLSPCLPNCKREETKY